MNKIDKTDTLRKILADRRFIVDYYQREYRWGRKQIEQMIDDLYGAFMEYYDPENHDTVKEVKNYGYYYMGSIICTGGTDKQIIDGQQRLTSLTLLLMYLNNLQKEKTNIAGLPIAFNNMIYKDDYGTRCFNIDVEERTPCFNAIYHQEQGYIPIGESNQVMTQRYLDIENLFPDDLKDEALPYFIYWVIDNILLLEIDTPSEDEAHTIFLTMNDRGLSLNSAEMMKAFVIQQVNETNRREVNEQWQNNINKIKSSSVDNKSGIVNAEDVEFISTWLKAKYANTLREGKKGSVDKDYELLGEKFHTWVRQNAKNQMGLVKPNDYYNFIMKEMTQVTNLYLRIKKYSQELTNGFEEVFYNANRDLNYQNILIISAISLNDPTEVVDKKIKLVSTFVDIFASTRILNYKKVNWNTNKYFLFKVLTNIREKDLQSMGIFLTKSLNNVEEKLDGLLDFQLNQYTGRYMLHMLARMVAFVNVKMGHPSKFSTYIDRTIQNSYDIEHILPNKFEDYKEYFNDEEDFENYRKKFGNLIILTKDKNRSYQDMKYSEKVVNYLGDNIMAQSLNENAYKNNPQFLKFVNQYSFAPVSIFTKTSVQERSNLYLNLAKDIWNITLLKDIAGGWSEDIQVELEIDKQLNNKCFTVEFADRSWEDAVKYGFLSANSSGSGKTISNISKNDLVFCHIAGKGFVGVGICTENAILMKDFCVKIENNLLPIADAKWQNENHKLQCDIDSELFIAINWIKTVPLDEGVWEKGMTSVPLVAYNVNDDTHINVLKLFNIKLK